MSLKHAYLKRITSPKKKKRSITTKFMKVSEFDYFSIKDIRTTGIIWTGLNDGDVIYLYFLILAV